MNILEAYKKLKEGNIIRCESTCDIYYAFQTTLVPLGIKDTAIINQAAAKIDENEPAYWGNIECEDLKTICLPFLEQENYTQVTEEEMFKEIEDYYKEE